MSVKNFTKLIAWSEDQYSHLPWRSQRTLYRTLVSEIMLQQTTVGTVLNHFEKFLLQYPTITELAKASEEQICISWKGLGYYRRARNLRNIARQIKEHHNGVIPVEIKTLLTLKGVGPYTANAIAAIGADKKALAVDANLERVLARYYGININKGANLQKYLQENFEAKKILGEIEVLSSRALNEALMDLGRVVCQSKKASCAICMLAPTCKAKSAGVPLSFPIENDKKKQDQLSIKLLRVIVKDQKKILVYQKSENEWLSGQWEIPTFIIESSDEKFVQYPKTSVSIPLESLARLKTVITKYKIENIILLISYQEFKKSFLHTQNKYVFKEYSARLNLSTASIKALKKVQGLKK